jgi:arylsulfatase A-like enzyme
MDWTATMIAAAGAKPSSEFPLDGEDITDVLRGRRPLFDRKFFWRTKRQGAMRSGTWKYIRDGKSESLHDLFVDEREQANFAESKPDILAKLRNEFESWESQMVGYPAG